MKYFDYNKFTRIYKIKKEYRFRSSESSSADMSHISDYNTFIGELLKVLSSIDNSKIIASLVIDGEDIFLSIENARWIFGLYNTNNEILNKVFSECTASVVSKKLFMMVNGLSDEIKLKLLLEE